MYLIGASVALTLIVWFASRRHRSRNLLLLGVLMFTVFGLAACGANWVQTAQELSIVISGLIPIVTSAAATLAPAESAAITSAANVVQGGLAALQQAIKSYNGNPSDTTLQKVQAILADVQLNLTQLEAAAQVKDPTTAKKIGAIVTAANATVAVLEASIMAKHPATVAAHQQNG